jgi:molybdate transport system ATP-binding protein
MSQLLFSGRHQYADGFTLDAQFEAGGGITALFGASGSGKSTVLASIAGILRLQAGRIVLGDRVLANTEAGIVLPPEQRRIGAVFQDHLLFPHLTIRRNLTFGQQRRPARSIDFHRVVEVLEIGDLLERRPDTLSGGQRQRVSLGRALLRGPELLLMDEPLTALDGGLKDRILTYLERAINEWHVPTLFVSHDQADVRRLADRVAVLANGRVIDAGPTKATLDRVVLTRLQPALSPINLLRVVAVRQVAGHWEGQVGDQTFQLPATAASHVGDHAQVQFLPQDVILARDSVAGLSVRNQLSGRIREMVTLAERVFVAVDIGQFLWAEVTPEAARELALQPGQSITCLVKTAAVRLIG